MDMILAIVYKIIMQENVKGIAVNLRKVNLQKNVERRMGFSNAVSGKY